MTGAVNISNSGVLLRENAGLFNRVHSDERLMLMCESALFAGLSSQECREIISYSRIKKYARGEVLFFQGRPVDSVVLIQSGRVKLTQLASDGREVILWVNGSGDAVGLHSDTRRGHSCSARAMDGCQALIWHLNTLRTLIAQYPQINVNLGRILADRLCELEERFREVASERVPSRLAFVLLRLLKSVGNQGREGVEVQLKREDLALMTGSTIFTISRLLSKWAHLGYIVPLREAIVIRDPDGLRASIDPGWTADRARRSPAPQHSSPAASA
jgi:CRP/FNR family transcriptional regulator, nitrogen oxide reductase regulator